MAYITRKDEIMARLGPEDNFTVVPVQKSSEKADLLTATPSFGIVSLPQKRGIPQSELHYKDETEAIRLLLLAKEDVPAGVILRDLAKQRNICRKQEYVQSVSTG